MARRFFLTPILVWSIGGVTLPKAALAITVPAGANIHVRLQQRVNTYSSEKDSSVQAVVVAPVLVNGSTAIPIGSTIHGSIQSVKRVGLGLVRERANLRIVFHRIELPNQRVLAVSARIAEVENARESVNEEGDIRGIRSTETPGYRGAGFLTSIAAVDPIALAFTTAAFASMLRFSEPEIDLPVGTDLRLTTVDDVESGAPWPSSEPVSLTPLPSLRAIVRSLPWRTRAFSGNREADITNLVFLGGLEPLQRAFRAAGWVQAADATAYSKYRALRSFVEMQGYREAPMSPMLLNGNLPVLNISKSLNTFFKRHHLRVFETGKNWDGQPVFTAAATHDIGIGIARQKFTHRIDGNIDAERRKVLDDLIFTGCVAWIEQLDRPWVPRVSANSTGDRLTTDARIAIVHFNDCNNPRRFDDAVTESPGPSRGNQAERITRQTVLTLRNDLIRGNIVYQTVAGIKLARRYLRTRGEGGHTPENTRDENAASPPEPNPDIPAGQSFVARKTRAVAGAVLQPWEPARVELGFRIASFRFGQCSAGPEGLLIERRNPSASSIMGLTTDSRVQGVWGIGAAVTLHTHRWVSHELGYQYQRGHFRLGLMGINREGDEAVLTGLEEQRVGLSMRQFSYNTLIHVQKPERRIRPYVAAGPALQLMSLSDAPFRKARGVWRFGLNNVGMTRASYNFGSAAPLEGGGIFQPAVQLGGGVRIRLVPRFTLVLDYRTTTTRHPDFLSKSLRHELPNLAFGELPEAGRIASPNRVSQHRLGTGISFSF